MPSPAKSVGKVPTILQLEGVTVFAPGPEFENLDDSELEVLRNALSDAASQADPPLLVLDLTNLRYFGSAFIEALFRAWANLKTRPSGRLALCGLSDYCREVLEITHLDRLWSVFQTRDEAVRSLRHD